MKGRFQEENFHRTGYGWNYGYNKAKNGKIRPYRYWTNGHVNSNYQYGKWFEYNEDVTIGVCEQLLHNKCVSY